MGRCLYIEHSIHCKTAEPLINDGMLEALIVHQFLFRYV